MLNKYVLAISVIIGVIGLSLAGDGLTGMAISGTYVKELCENNSDCKASEVCCYFQNQQSGVCNNNDMCNEITALTASEYNKNPVMLNNQNNQQAEDFYKGEAFLGLLMILLTIGYFYYYLRMHVTKSANHH